MADIRLRPVQPGDYEAVYGEPLKHSIKGYTVTIDGEPRGIAGVAYVDGQVNAFSRGLPGIPKKWIVRGTRLTLEMIRGMDCPVLAIADPNIPTAPGFLEWCGFEHVTTNSQGEVYRWRHRQPR
jgi:hypothetical protein